MIGFPWLVVVGKSMEKEGRVELQRRGVAEKRLGELFLPVLVFRACSNNHVAVTLDQLKELFEGAYAEPHAAEFEEPTDAATAAPKTATATTAGTSTAAARPNAPAPAAAKSPRKSDKPAAKNA